MGGGNIFNMIINYFNKIYNTLINPNMFGKVIKILFVLIISVLYFIGFNNCSDFKDCRTCIGCNK